MKIGFSYSRCVRDIIDGKVDIDEVLVIISRTDFDPHDDVQWLSIWKGYGGGQTAGSPFSLPEWGSYPAEDEDRFRSVSIELWESGKLHQPRKFGAHPARAYDVWVDTGPMPGDLVGKPDAVIDAWKNYQMLSSLAK